MYLAKSAKFAKKINGSQLFGRMKACNSDFPLFISFFLRELGVLCARFLFFSHSTISTRSHEVSSR
jgi:hypothetical protein